VLLLAESVAPRARLVGETVPPVPVPDRPTSSVPLVALLVMARFADTEPFAVGAKVTATVNEAPAASVVPAVFVSANGGPAAIEEIVAVAVPVFLIVTVVAAVVEPTASLPNATEVGVAVRVAVGAAVPVPVRATVKVPLVALLDTVSEPDALPVAVGVNVTDAVHEAPAASELPQVLVSANGDPVVIEEIAAAAVPVLEIVTDCAALVDPTVSLPRDREVGEAVRVALPALVPVPDRPTVRVLLVALLATVRDPEAAPVAVGVKVTDAVHDAPAARELPQVLLSPNGDADEIEEIDAAAVPVLEIVTV